MRLCCAAPDTSSILKASRTFSANCNARLQKQRRRSLSRSDRYQINQAPCLPGAQCSTRNTAKPIRTRDPEPMVAVARSVR
jgi:hypothetical protein